MTVALGLLVMLALNGLDRLRLGSSEFRGMLAVMSIIGLFVTVSVMVLIRNVRIQARLDAARGRLCFRCGKELPVATDAAPCPHCGRACEAQRDADLWRKTGFVVRDPHEVPSLTSKQPPPPPS